MSLLGFRCPDSTPTAGRENVGLGNCLDCPHACAPIGVIWKMWQVEGNNPHVGDMVSPTSLPRCPRKLKLSRTKDYFIEPMARYDALRGTLYHSFVEMNGVEDVMTEKRVYKMVTKGPNAPWVMSGQVDHYSIKRRKIEDFKTTREKSLPYLFNGGPKQDHIAQLSCYAWLLVGGHLGSLDGPVVDWAVDSAQIHYLTLGGCYSTGTRIVERIVQKASPNYGRAYKYEVKRDIVGKNKNSINIWHITIDMPPVVLWSMDETEAYIIEKGAPLVRAFREPDYIPPGVMHDPDNSWECDYCDHVPQCEAIEESQKLHWLGSGPPLPLDEPAAA